MVVPVGPMPVVWMMTSPSLAQTKWVKYVKRQAVMTVSASGSRLLTAQRNNIALSAAGTGRARISSNAMVG